MIKYTHFHNLSTAKMHFISFVLGYALLLVLSLSQSGQAREDFSHSCTSFSIEGNNILLGICLNGSGGVTRSAVDLNACIGIGQSDLIYQVGYAYHIDLEGRC